MVHGHILVCLVLLLPSGSGLIMPMTKSSGDPDMISIINHVTLMEQTISSLQTQVQTATTQLTNVNSKLQMTEEELKSVKADVKTISDELSLVKGKLQTTEDELQLSKKEATAVKAEMKLAETEIALLKHDLQKGPDPVEFSLLKTELDALKAMTANPAQRINLTVVDSISTDVKSNVMQIQSIKSQFQVLQDCCSMVQNRQNITEQNVLATKGLVNTTVTDVKAVQTQVNNISGDINNLFQELSVIKNRTGISNPDTAYSQGPFTTRESITPSVTTTSAAMHIPYQTTASTTCTDSPIVNCTELVTTVHICNPIVQATSLYCPRTCNLTC